MTETPAKAIIGRFGYVEFGQISKYLPPVCSDLCIILSNFLNDMRPEKTTDPAPVQTQTFCLRNITCGILPD